MKKLKVLGLAAIAAGMFSLTSCLDGGGNTQQLSSYAIVLMLIHFLIKKKKINLIYDARNRSNTLPNFMFKRRKNEEVQ